MPDGAGDIPEGQTTSAPDRTVRWARVRRNAAWLLITAVVILVALHLWRGRASPVGPLAVHTEGGFSLNGEYPSTPAAPTPRHWGSYTGADANTGKLVLGPFPAPSHLKVAISGYPHRDGNDLYLEMTFLGIRLPLDCGDVGERWETKEYAIPPGWQGWQVTLVAVDHAKGWGGWLGVSEPLPPSGGTRLAVGLGDALAAWAINGLLLGLLFVAAARAISGLSWLPPEWVALVAAGTVALVGYGVFWVYCLSAGLGHVVVVLLLAGAALLWVGVAPQPESRGREWTRVVAGMVCVGAVYLALMYLFSGPWGLYELASNRFLPALPGDNRVPHDLAMTVYDGRGPKAFDADWLSSDRPPLQSGWELLTLRVMDLLGFEPTLATAASAIWFQLLWIPAGYGLLRTLMLPARDARAVTLALAASGFFLVNTVFTWPKLCAAAFVVGSFGVLVGRAGATWRGFAVAVALGAIGWLCHGGVAFSLLPLGILLVWRAYHVGVRAWLWGLALALMIGGPWIAYQKWYDPPGDRLLKWHLAGQMTKDESRGVVRTLRENYAAAGWSKAVAARVANLKEQLPRDWTWWHDFSGRRAQDRRSDEFFHHVRTFDWWLLGALVLPLGAARGGFRASWTLHGALLTWTLAAFALWILLLFSPGAAIVHQGSYAITLSGFVLLAAWLWLASRWLFAIVFVVQLVQFVVNSVVPSTAVDGPVNVAAVAVALLATLAGILVVLGRQSRVPNQAAR
jgi:hypothetical protein